MTPATVPATIVHDETGARLEHVPFAKLVKDTLLMTADLMADARARFRGTPNRWDAGQVCVNYAWPASYGIPSLKGHWMPLWRGVQASLGREEARRWLEARRTVHRHVAALLLPGGPSVDAPQLNEDDVRALAAAVA